MVVRWVKMEAGIWDHRSEAADWGGGGGLGGSNGCLVESSGIREVRYDDTSVRILLDVIVVKCYRSDVTDRQMSNC